MSSSDSHDDNPIRSEPEEPWPVKDGQPTRTVCQTPQDPKTNRVNQAAATKNENSNIIQNTLLQSKGLQLQQALNSSA